MAYGCEKTLYLQFNVRKASSGLSAALEHSHAVLENNEGAPYPLVGGKCIPPNQSNQIAAFKPYLSLFAKSTTLLQKDLLMRSSEMISLRSYYLSIFQIFVSILWPRLPFS